jgi:hypothetical protein
MAVTRVAFKHNDFVFAKNETVDDDHPMIALAPHLFDIEPVAPPVLPAPNPATKAAPGKQPNKE